MIADDDWEHHPSVVRVRQMAARIPEGFDLLPDPSGDSPAPPGDPLPPAPHADPWSQEPW